MANVKRRQNDKTPRELSEEIAGHVAAFLNAGGKIDRIDRGVSGVEDGRRPLVISAKTHPNAT